MILRFGEFELDGEAFELSRGGSPLEVQPRVLAVLLHLVRERERMVTREELLRAVWADVHVEEDSLYRAVAIARRLLAAGTGVADPIRTVRGRGYRFAALVAEVERAAASRGPIPPGRAGPLDALREALARACGGERQLVVLSGEAGIGKTRVADAFVAELRRTGDVQGTRGQCLEPLGGGEPYSPLLEAVARLCRRAGSEVVDVLRDRAPSWLAQLPALCRAGERRALEREARSATRERLTEELADALEEVAARRPLVVVLEDLQWCDRGTLGLLASLARRREPARLLLLATARTGEPTGADTQLRRLLAELKTEGRCHELPLPPLAEDDLRQLVRQRLRGSEPAPGLVRWLRERSAGNPLFAHHLLDFAAERKLLEHGPDGARREGALASLGVPSTLAELIEHQIEGLDPLAVRLLEAAAAAGPEFSAAEVAAGLEMDVAAAEDRCDELARRAVFLARSGVAEWSDGALSERFRFLHALHREVLASRIAPSRQRELHGRVGRFLEQGLGDGSPEAAPLLAYHFERGGEPGRAVPYYVAAVERAARRHSGHEAKALAEQALALLPRLPPDERDARELALRFALAPALPEALGFADAAVDANLARAEALCERCGDAERRLAVLWSRCYARFHAGDADQAVALAERLLADARALGRPAFELLAHDALAFSQQKRCRFEVSLHHAERVLEIDEPERHSELSDWIGQDVRVDAAIISAFDLWYLGRPAAAAARIERAVALARRSGHGYSQALALCYAAAFHVAAEDLARARDAADQAMQRARVERLPSHRLFAELMRAAALPSAPERLAGMLAWLRSLPPGGEVPRGAGASAVRALFAHAFGEVGQRELALTQIAEAFAEAERNGEREPLPGLHVLRASLAANEVDALRDLRRALATAGSLGHRMAELQSATELARLEAASGLRGEALARLAERTQEMAGEPDVPVLARARALLRELGAA